MEEIARQTFTRWERLRIPYNLFLTLLTAWMHWPILTAIPYAPWILLPLLICAVGANVCFMAGPLVESYLIWVGFRSRWTPVVLFLGGLAISVPLVWLFPLFFMH